MKTEGGCMLSVAAGRGSPDTQGDVWAGLWGEPSLRMDAWGRRLGTEEGTKARWQEVAQHTRETVKGPRGPEGQSGRCRKAPRSSWGQDPGESWEDTLFYSDWDEKPMLSSETWTELNLRWITQAAVS